MSAPEEDLVAPDAGDATKTCPDCAETVKAGANVCRYCGHRFAAAPPPPREGKRSVSGATILSLVVAGLGQLYLGETRRGLVYLASVGVCAYGAIVAAFPGPVVLLAIGSAIDAWQSARATNTGAPARGVTGAMWAAFAATLLIVAVGVSQAPSGDGGGDADAEWRQQQYTRCVLDGLLPETRCANIYLAP